MRLIYALVKDVRVMGGRTRVFCHCSGKTLLISQTSGFRCSLRPLPWNCTTRASELHWPTELLLTRLQSSASQLTVCPTHRCGCDIGVPVLPAMCISGAPP